MFRISILLGICLLPTLAEACGTIKMWHQKYYEATTDTERLDALKFLHCEPIVANFHFETEETALLLQLVDNAMSRAGLVSQYAHAYQSYAAKVYLVYGLYRGSDDVIQHAMVQEEVGQFFGVEYFPFDPEFKTRVGEHLAIFRPFGTFYETMDYVQVLDRQFRALKQALDRPVAFSTQDQLTTQGHPVTVSVSGDVDRAMNMFFPKTLELSGTIEQTIAIPNNCLCEWNGTGQAVLHNIKFEDLNFDGYRDLRVFDNAGATGNRWDVIWLYDQETKQYVYSDELSGLSALRLGEEPLTLQSFESQGWCSRQWTTFAWQEGELVPIKARYTEVDEETGACELVTGSYEAGQFVVESRKPFSSEQ